MEAMVEEVVVAPAMQSIETGKNTNWAVARVEIDTSAPFESVKEAVDRFGGRALWKSQLRRLFSPQKQCCLVEVDAMKVEEQIVQIENDLIMKEKETLAVLKELETTKTFMGELKLKLQEEVSEVTKGPDINSASKKVYPVPDIEEHSANDPKNQHHGVGKNVIGKQSPGLILMELKQAKVNLSKTTSDITGIRASIGLLSSKIEEEKLLLEKTCLKLAANTAEVSNLEEELNQTTIKLNSIRNTESDQCLDPLVLSATVKELNSDSEKFKEMNEATKSEVSKLTTEIEKMRSSMRAAEITFLAAKQMEETARGAQVATLAEARALTNGDYTSTDIQNSSKVILSIEQYAMLTRKAEEVDGVSRKKIEAAILEVDEANQSKQELLLEVEEAKKNVKTKRKVLEESLKRAEVANRGKLAVEEALRKWRSENAQNQRSFHNHTKLKNSGPTHHQRNSQMLNMHALTWVGKRSSSAVTIGQILRRKMMNSKDHNVENVSLAQMLNKKICDESPSKAEASSSDKQLPEKRKKLGILGFLTSANQKQNKKRRQRLAVKAKQSSRHNLS